MALTDRQYTKLEFDTARAVFEAAALKIQKKVISAIANRSTQSDYWINAQQDVNNVFDLLNIYWRKWSAKTMPFYYVDGMTVIGKAFDELGMVRKLKEGSFQRAAVQQLVTQTVNDMDKAIKGGQNQIADLFRLTQQDAVTEDRINKALAETMISENTPGALKTNLRKELEAAVGDGRVFVSSGRSYEPGAYAELVARTRTREAQTIGAKSIMLEFGLDLVQISSHGSDTPICLDHGAESDQVFSLTGETAGYSIADVLPPFHPNCQHVVVPYVLSAA